MPKRAEPWRNGSNLIQPWLSRRAEFRQIHSNCFRIKCPREQSPDERFELVQPWLSQRAEFRQINSNCFRIKCPREQSPDETVQTWFSLDCPGEQNSDKSIRTAWELNVQESRALTKRFELVRPWLSQSRIQTDHFELLQNWFSQRPESCQNILNWSFVYWVIILRLCLLPYVYCFTMCVLLSYILQLPDCWLEVSIRKVLRPATSTQVFHVFPLSKSKCWDGSQDSKFLLHASRVALPT